MQQLRTLPLSPMLQMSSQVFAEQSQMDSQSPWQKLELKKRCRWSQRCRLLQRSRWRELVLH